MTLTRCRSRCVRRKRPNFKATDLPPSSLAWFVWSGLGQGLPVWFPVGLGAAAILGAELISHLAVNSGSSPDHTTIEIVGPQG